MSRYLLRFDDISPYMNWEIWDEIEAHLDALDVKPLVAIIPDCKDLNIMPSVSNDSFLGSSLSVAIKRMVDSNARIR